MNIRNYALYITLALIGALMFVSPAAAWSNGTVTYDVQPDPHSTYSTEYESFIHKERIQLLGYDGKVTTVDAQVDQGKSMRLARAGVDIAIALGTDSVFVHLNATPYPKLVAGTNAAVIPFNDQALDGHPLSMTDDLSSIVYPVYENAQLHHYNIDMSKAKPWLRYVRGNDGATVNAHVYNWVYSKNSRYGVFWLDWKYFVRVDFQTGDILAFTSRDGTWYDGIYASRASAITNDGRYVFMDDGSSVTEITPGCGLKVDPASYTGSLDRNKISCPQESLGLTPLIGYDAWHRMFHLSDDESSGTYLLAPFPYTTGGPAVQQRVTVSVDPGTISGLTYLALGDSYSSGEGDIGKKTDGLNYYLSGTASAGDCHVSSRSYPFLLRDKWGLDSSNMRSVACSGARVLPDMYGNPDNYTGQGSRHAGSSNDDRNKIQESALEKFTPGDVQQLEFVKKYKPSIITLTGGGNDVGFASMLSYCAYGSGKLDTAWDRIEEGIYGIFTCSYAIPNSVVQQITLRAISDQYTYTAELLKRIKEVSPQSKVYMIGYPSFVSVGPVNCISALELDVTERRTVQYFLALLNSNLKKAADDQGVTFIDVQDSLNGGRICEGSEYMTDIKKVDVLNESDMNGLFHPNAEGHEKMAEVINQAIEENVQPNVAAPQKPNMIGVAYDGFVMSLKVTTGNIIKNSKITLSVPGNIFKPDTLAKVVLHSDPINLGDVTVAHDGSIHEQISKNNLPVGFHLLTIEGTSLSGEKLIVYQPVTVGAEGAAASSSVAEDTDHSLSGGGIRALGQQQQFVTAPTSTYSGLTINPITKSSSVNIRVERKNKNTSKESADMYIGNMVIGLLLIIALGIILVAGTIYGIKKRHKKE